MFYHLMTFDIARIGLYCFTVFVLAIFVLSVKKESRRFLNCVLLAILVCCIWQSIVIYLGFNLAIDIGGIATTPVVLLLLFVAVLLIWNGVIVVKKEGFSLAHILPILVGLCIFGVLFVYIFSILFIESVDTPTTLFQLQIISKVINLVVDLIIYFPVLLICFYIYGFFYQRLSKKGPTDFILVLGCGLRGKKVSPILAQRLKKGIAYYHSCKEKCAFVVSGGQGKDEVVSEAFAMKSYLCEHGIDEDKIIMEDKSTTTRENMIFSKQIMETIKKNYTCVFVTNNYHVLRSAILARNIGLNAQGIGCKTAGYYHPSASIREGIAIIVSYRKVYLAYVIYCLISFGLNMIMI